MAGSAGPIQIPVWPCWIHIDAIGDDVNININTNDDLSASSRYFSINYISNQILRIFKIIVLYYNFTIIL